MKRVLIISPNFPPINGADMQRVRMSLPYFFENGWEAEVVMVDEKYNDVQKDQLLLQSVPTHTSMHKVNAFSKKWTSKFGLGSIALRSLWFYKKYVNQLLKKKHFDLIYFSTTAFPVLILGAYWKKKYGIPYVIDMQDPWHSDYYKAKPKHERPKKYWFSYRLNKCLEPIAMKSVGGLISVSQAYIDTLKNRYTNLKEVPTAVIPFGSHEIDFEIATLLPKGQTLAFQPNKTNIVYTGAVGHVMKDSITFLCEVLSDIKRTKKATFEGLHFYFIGTSYAPNGQRIATVMPLAKNYDVESCFTEITGRIGYFECLSLLTRANALIILGSDDRSYNPSKIFTYALAKKNIISIFKSKTPATDRIETYCNGVSIKHEMHSAKEELTLYLETLVNNPTQTNYQKKDGDLNTAKVFTKQQCEVFNKVIN